MFDFGRWVAIRCLCVAVLTTAMPAPSSVAAELVPLTFDCLADAAEKFGHDWKNLVLILAVEGGRVGECSTNKNKTIDCGPAQINSVHFSELSRVTQMPRAELQAAVTNNGCFNIYVGAYLLRKRINEAHGDVWKGIAHYHSYTPYHMEKYQEMVMKKYRRYFGNDVMASTFSR